jgi:exodeoxyribonuclease X
MTNKYVVVDVETTGLSPEKDKVVEIAAAWRHKGNLFYASNLINPENVSIPPEVSAITHLTDEDVRTAPPVENVISEKGFPPGILVAHNASFDRAFLPQFENRIWLDTLKISKHLWPNAPNHKNMTLKYFLKLKPDLPVDLAPHRALYDVLVTMAIFEYILQTHTIEQLLELQKQPILLTVARFGRYKGQSWSTIDKSYLQWLLKQDESGGIDEDIRHTARYWLTH